MPECEGSNNPELRSFHVLYVLIVLSDCRLHLLRFHRLTGPWDSGGPVGIAAATSRWGVVMRSILLVCFCLFLTAGVASADYLPRAGPNPVRMRVAPSVPAVLIPDQLVLEASRTNEIETLPATGSGSEAASNAVQGADSEAGDEKRAALRGTLSGQTAVVPVFLFPDEVIDASDLDATAGRVSESPDSQQGLGNLLRYFSSTNDGEGKKGVVVPVVFAPPVPISTLSSKATYISE